MRVAKSKGFTQQRRDVQDAFPSDHIRGNGGMFTAGRKKGKLEAINRQAALWIPVTPRLIVIGSRLSPDAARDILEADELNNANLDSTGSLLVIVNGHAKALIHVWKKYLAPERSHLCKPI